MSSKDYSFEITTNSSRNSVSFTVKNKRTWLAAHARLPLVFLVAACIFPRLKALLDAYTASRQGLWDHAADTARHLAHGRIHHVLAQCQDSLVVALAAAVVFALLALRQASDSLMVVEAMGVQLSSESRWRFLDFGKKREFIPISEIIDIVVHEGFHGYGQVIFYMCVLTREKDKNGNGVKVIFPNFLPRKEILLQAWKSSRQMLYGTNRRHYRHVPGHGLREVMHLE